MPYSDFRPRSKQLTNKRYIEQRGKTELKKIIIIEYTLCDLNSTESIFVATRSLPKCNDLKHCPGDTISREQHFNNFKI